MTKKQTTREKQISEAAIGYADKICKSRVLDDFNVSVQEMIGVAFFHGAKVADTNPRRGLVKIQDVEAILVEAFKKGEISFKSYHDIFCRMEDLL